MSVPSRTRHGTRAPPTYHPPTYAFTLFLFVFSPTKITLIGAVLFALQKNQHLPIQTNHLMLFYTVFIVVNKVSRATTQWHTYRL